VTEMCFTKVFKRYVSSANNPTVSHLL